MATKILMSGKLHEALKDAGLVPPQCRRVVIDAEAGKVVKIHYETFADERIIQVISSAGLTVVTEPPPDPKFLTDSELQRGMDHLVERQRA